MRRVLRCVCAHVGTVTVCVCGTALIILQQLVSSVFRELWFTVPPTGADQREALERRVHQITAVVRPFPAVW